MVNIEKYVAAIKLTWLKRLTTGDFGKWKVIPQHLFDKCGKNFLIFHMNTNSIKALPAANFLSEFYLELTKTWMKYNGTETNIPQNFRTVVKAGYVFPYIYMH